MSAKILPVVLGFIVLLVVVTPVFAQEMPVSNDASSSSAPVAQPLMGTSPVKTLRQAFQQDKEAFREQVSQMRQEVQSKIQAEKAALKEQLQKIKDVRKQQVVENINDKIVSINEKYTGKWSDSLDKMQTNLTALQAKATSTSAGVQTDITAAQTAITVAKTAVSAQAGKTYSIQVVSDATLRTTVGQTVTEFRTDLLGVQKQVMAAHTAIQKVRMDLGENSAMPTGTASSSALQQ